MLTDEGGAVGADRDDVADESLVEQPAGAGHGFGEPHVVADLRAARDGWSAGRTSWEASRFTVPFARTEENKFSELPELDNIDNFYPEMRKFVDSIRTGAPVAVPVSDALDVALVVDACYRSEQASGADTRLTDTA